MTQQIRFYQGVYNQENLDRLKQNGAVRVQNVFISPDGSLTYLIGDSSGEWQEVKADNRKIDLEKGEEGFGKTDSKTSIYDLEGRIKEINGGIEVPMEKIERMIETYEDIDVVKQILDSMYPNGFKQVIYSDEDMSRYRGLRRKAGIVEDSCGLTREEIKRAMEGAERARRDYVYNDLK